MEEVANEVERSLALVARRWGLDGCVGGMVLNEYILFIYF
jgi:hypothetical protein